MLLKKIILIVSCILLTCVSGLWAGDSASFVDLGFSQDGRIFMFGQYGVELPSLHPWADIYIVDVNTNRFVQNGVITTRPRTPIKAGQDGSGVLYQLLNDNSAIVSRHGVNLHNQGMPLYISRELHPPVNGERITFRNFYTNTEYTAQLIPTITGSRENVRGRFHINLTSVNLTNGQRRTYPTIGLPDFNRRRVEQYNIKSVLVDSGNSSLIFVIEMKQFAENGHNFRYMVEVIRL